MYRHFLQKALHSSTLTKTHTHTPTAWQLLAAPPLSQRALPPQTDVDTTKPAGPAPWWCTTLFPTHIPHCTRASVHTKGQLGHDSPWAPPNNLPRHSLPCLHPHWITPCLRTHSQPKPCCMYTHTHTCPQTHYVHTRGSDTRDQTSAAKAGCLRHCLGCTGPRPPPQHKTTGTKPDQK